MKYLESAPLDVCVITCADRLHNVRAMTADHEAMGDALWCRFKRGRELQG